MVPAAFVPLRRAAADRPTARSTAGRCRRPTARGPSWPRLRGAARRRSRRSLAGIWAEVLGVERVGRRTTTSSSSAATRCWPPRSSRASATPSASSCRCARCSRRPRSAGLAAPVERRCRAGEARRGAAARAACRARARCPSPSPRSGSGSSTSSSPGSAAYNVPGALRLAGRLDVPALERAPDEIVRRHEVLRTTFGLVDGRLVAQRRPRQLTLSTPVVDLSAVPEPLRERRPGAGQRRRRLAFRSGPAPCCAPCCSGSASATI